MFQLTAMQERMRKLVEESTRKKKEKKKNKLKKKAAGSGAVSAVALPNSSSTGKPGAHGAINKTNSLVDSVDDSIASVVSGGDMKMSGGEAGTTHHPAAAKSLSVHHNMAAAGANATAQVKTSKTKGENCMFQFILKATYFYNF